jgi:O-antigen/teichoic acid export membrane protein
MRTPAAQLVPSALRLAAETTLALAIGVAVAKLANSSSLGVFVAIFGVLLLLRADGRYAVVVGLAFLLSAAFALSVRSDARAETIGNLAFGFIALGAGLELARALWKRPRNAELTELFAQARDAVKSLRIPSFDTAPVRSLMRQGAFLIAATLAVNISNYVFHIIMTRLLGPASYGALGALLAVLLVLAVPTAAVQAVVARRAAILSQDPERVGELLRSTINGTLQAGLAIAGIMAALSHFIAGFLHVPTVAPVLLVAAMMIPGSVAPAARGIMQGTMRFGALGASLLAITAMKLGLGVILVKAGFGLSGAVAAVAVAETVGVVVLLWPVRRSLMGSWAGLPGEDLISETGRALLALLAYWILVSADLLLARHYLPERTSGKYAAAALLGRAVLFLPAAVGMVIYPKLSESPGSPQARRIILWSTGIVSAIGGAAAVGIAVFPGVVSFMFGEAYRGAGAVAEVLVIAMAAFGVVNLLLYYRLAQSRPPILTLWAAVAADVIAIVVLPHNATFIATIVLVVGLSLTAWLGLQMVLPVRRPEITSDELWQPPASDLDISVVVPSFNAASGIVANITRLGETLRGSRLRHEVILVSDGSTDGTPKVARASLLPGLRVVHYDRNQGKGHALRMGLSRARGEFVAFIDADGDLDPDDLRRFLELMKLYEADLVIGSKRHPLSRVTYPFRRRLMSWCYHRLVRILFGIKVTDTQTGIKLVRRDVLARTLPHLVEKRFAFDLELLVAARRLGYRRILEAPIRLDYQFSSSISRSAIVGILQDTAAIWYRRFVLRYYDRADTGDQAAQTLLEPSAESRRQADARPR